MVTSFGIFMGGRNVCGRIPPKAVFLDLNLPRIDGWQVLVAINKNEQLRSIPVVVLSTILETPANNLHMP